MGEMLGGVLTVSGSQMTVGLEADHAGSAAIRIGAMVKVGGADRAVVGTIGAVRLDGGSPPRRVLAVDLQGEIVPSAGGRARFSRGVSHHPIAGAKVYAASADDLGIVYAQPSRSNIRVGTLYHDATQPAYLLVDELLAKHFAVLGTSGSGKSCAVTLILSAILAGHPNAHVIVLDPHNEYAAAFGDVADVITVDNLELPFWLFDFEEAVRILARGGTTQDQEAQAIILKDAITWARRHYAGDGFSLGSITVDTPVPFRVFDLIRYLNEEMGRLGRPDTATPYLRLRTRLESLRDDRRFAFMFSDVTHDTLSELVGRLLRIPVSGKPLTIVDLSGVPSEIADVVVSLSCRVMFDFAVWSARERMPPILLVCEEAHRYVPADERVGFDATARAVTRIAKEGRKYGLSLGLVSQRPSELATHALSQCGTVFAMHLGNDVDQRFVAGTLPDAAQGMLAALPSLRTQEAIVSGEGVQLPMRMCFDDLPPGRRPHGDAAQFSQVWQSDSADVEFREEAIRRWRLQRRVSG